MPNYYDPDNDYYYYYLSYYYVLYFLMLAFQQKPHHRVQTQYLASATASAIYSVVTFIHLLIHIGIHTEESPAIHTLLVRKLAIIYGELELKVLPCHSCRYV